MFLSAILAVVFSFPGGTPTSFANKLFDETKRPVIVSQALPTSLPKMEFDPDDMDSIVAGFRAAETTVKMPGVEMSFSDGLIVPAVLNATLQVRSATSVAVPTLAKDAVKDGLVTLKMDSNQMMKVSNLADLGFSKSLEVHRTLNDVSLAVRVEGMEEREFLIKVCKLIGGKLLSNSKQYKIVPYGPEFTKRVVKTLRLCVSGLDKTKNAFFLSSMDARIALIQELSESELMEALDSAGEKRKFSMPSKQKAAAAFVAYMRLGMKTKPADSREGNSIIPETNLQNVAWQKSVFYMDSRLNVTAEIVVVDPGSKEEERRTYVLGQGGGAPN